MRCHTHGCIGNNRKGQSAIEYLTTYGWMLLVVAIVGGAIFTTVQNSSQIQSTSGLANADVQVEDFGVTESGFEAELRGASSDQVENVNFSLKDPETGETVYSIEEKTIPVGSTETVALDNISSGENTNTYEVELEYDTGGLEGLTTEGTITGRLELNGSTGGGGSENDGSEGGDSGGVTGDWSEPVSTAPSCNNYPQEYAGSGTESDPYIVMNSSGLQCMNQALDKNYVLGQNINASGTEQWNGGSGYNANAGTGENFFGTFDGNGSEIRGLTINGGPGLFGNTEAGAVVQDVSLTDVNITADSKIGSITADARSGSVIKNVELSGRIEGGETVGALVGLHGGNITNSSSSAMVIGDKNTGGLVGTNQGNITNSTSSGKIDGVINTGGLVGIFNSGSIENSFASGDVKGSLATGGLVGRNEVDLTGVHAEGDVNGSFATGGLVGVDGQGIKRSYSTGDVYANASFEKFEQECSNSGLSTTTCEDNLYFVAGGARGTGGLVGYGVQVEESFSTGNVEADVTEATPMGGLIGNFISSTTNGGVRVDNSYYIGNIDHSGSPSNTEYKGGLAGRVNGFEINNSFAVADVSANGVQGALAGSALKTAIAATPREENISIRNSYWNTDLAGDLNPVGELRDQAIIGDSVNSLGTSDMTGGSASSNMGNLSFEDKWDTVDNEYPVLQGLDRQAQLTARD